MSRDVVFDESSLWYSLLPLTPNDSVPIIEDESSESQLTLEEEKIDTLEKILISFWLSGLNDELDRDGQPIDMSASEEDSIVQSPWWKPRKWLTHKEKGKKRMSEHDNLEQVER